jgi:hypothetical protein
MNARIDWLFRSPDTGKLVIAQTPNLPLGLFLVATVVRRLADPDGAAATAAAVVAGVALVWWAVDEVLRGDSRFRRLLGVVVLTIFVAGRAGVGA